MSHALRTDWPRYVWLALLVVAGAVSLLCVRDGWRSTTVQARVATVAQRLEPAPAPPPAPVDDAPRRRDSGVANTPGALAVKRIQDRYLFVPKPPDRFRDIRGVLGDRVLYDGGQSFAVGENAMGATVMAVGSDWVEFEFNGETVKIEMFDRRGRGSGASGGGDEGRGFGRNRGGGGGREGGRNRGGGRTRG